jgi:sugar lactone lactonase YvrE
MSSSLPATVLAGILLYIGLLVIPASAGAAGSHVFKEIFGSANQPEFQSKEAEGMAIDPSGNLLVIDQDTDTISRWDEDGTPVNFPALGSNEITGFPLPGGGFEEFFFTGPDTTQIAVDSSGHIYVPQFQKTTAVYVFNPDGSDLPPLTESSEGPFATPCGVAVDPSGNVYVADHSNNIHKFPPTGGLPVNGDSEELEFSEACNLAAGAGPTNGFIFPTQFPSGKVSKLDSPTGVEEYEVDPGPATTVAVDPGTGHLYIAKGKEIEEFDVSGPTPEEIEPPIEVDGPVRGIAINGSTGNVYITRGGSKSIEVFGPRVSVLPLTIVKGGTGQGSVKSEPPEINCGPTCPEQTGFFGEGEPVPLKAKAAPGSVFTGWATIAGDPGTCTGTTTPCEVPMSEATELEAVFDLLPGPAVEALDPDEGPTGGGNLVEITGENLAEATQVAFGSSVVQAPFPEKTATKLKLIAPNHIGGTVDVIVTTTSGTSPNTPTDDYTFVADPHVTGLSPNSGPIGGGNVVQITGTNLAEATQVEFGGTVVNGPFTENTDTAITLTAPAHPAGTVGVRVTTAGGPSLSFPTTSNYTFAVPSPPPPLPPPPLPLPEPEPPKIGTPRIASNASFGGGKAALKVSCEGSDSCAGKITLKAKIKGKNRVIGSSSFSLGVGKSQTIRVRITDAQAKKRLKEGKVVKASLSGPGLAGTVRIAPSGG